MTKHRERDRTEKSVSGMAWYTRQLTFDAILVLALLGGIPLSYLRSPVIVLDSLAFGGLLAGGFYAGHFLWGLVRRILVEKRKWYMSQRLASTISLGIFLLSFVILYPNPSTQARSYWFFLLPFVQGVGVALGRQGPMFHRYEERQFAKMELVELLAELTKKSQLDPSDDPAIFDELDRMVRKEIWDPSLRRVYEKDRIWIIQDLRERWRREKRGEVTDIFSTWKKIIETRQEVRGKLAAHVGSRLIPERESLFPELAKLPAFYSELVGLLVRMTEYIDDFERDFVHGLSTKKPEAGDRALALVLLKVGLNPGSDCVRTWFYLRELRNGVAHPSGWREKREFQEALQYFQLTETELFASPRVVWSTLSRAYLDSLKDLSRILDSGIHME